MEIQLWIQEESASLAKDIGHYEVNTYQHQPSKKNYMDLSRENASYSNRPPFLQG
jgi:hypothetical protein